MRSSLDVIVPSRARSRLLLGTLIGLLVLLTAGMVAGGRIPGGHDALQQYMVRYVFLNEAVGTGSVSLWNPYTAHGSVVTMWYGLHATHFLAALHAVCRVAPGLVAAGDGVTWFHAGLLFDHALLILGLWLWSRQNYRRPEAAFIVTAAGYLSAIGMDQLYFNLQEIYVVPMVLYLLQAFLKDGMRWRILASASLVVFPPLGYMIPLVAFAIGVHGFAAWIVKPKGWGGIGAVLRPRPTDIFWIAGVVAWLLVLVTLKGLGTDEMRIVSAGRNADGSTPLFDFLTYAGNLGPSKYLDLLIGASPASDFTVYCGAFTIFFALLAVLVHPGRGTLRLLIGLGILLFFSLGILGGVAFFAYEFFPAMKYFRHIAMAAPLVRLWIILLAGAGADAYFGGRRVPPPLARILGLIFVVIAIMIGMVAMQLDRDPTGMQVFLAEFLSGLWLPASASGILPGQLRVTGFSFLLAGVLGLVGSLGARHRPLVGTLILLFHTLDLGAYRVFQDINRTIALTEEQRTVQAFGPAAYQARRGDEPGERRRTMASVVERAERSSTYWTYDAYFREEPPIPRRPVSFWMRSFDRLLRAFADGDPAAPPYLEHGLLRLVDTGPAFARVAGVAADKLSVHRAAVFLASDSDRARVMTDEQLGGRVLLIETAASDHAAPLTDTDPAWTVVPADVEIVSFSEGALRVRVTSEDGRWLLYRDAWHPDWKAWVDGRPVSVERADLAYKAVPIEPGTRDVEFRFEIPHRGFILGVYQVVSLAWVVGIVAGFVTVWRREGADPE